MRRGRLELLRQDVVNISIEIRKEDKEEMSLPSLSNFCKRKKLYFERVHPHSEMQIEFFC